jgi:hypothetical protein
VRHSHDAELVGAGKAVVRVCVRSERKRLEVGGDGAASGPERLAAERREEAAVVTADWAGPAIEKEAGEEGEAPALGWASAEQRRRGKGLGQQAD